jgi:O-antigen/teichoic acid export membrane protein
MLKRIKGIFLTDVNRNSFVLLYGTIISQALPLAFSPILARLYTPAEFGAFSLFYGISSVLGNMSAGKFDLALYTAKSKVNATITALSGMVFTLIITLTLFLICLVISAFIEFESLTFGLILCIPFTVFSLGASQVVVAFSNREKRFKDISRSRIMLGATWVVVNLICGLLNWGSLGLVLGYCLGQTCSLYYLYYKNRSDIHQIKLTRNIFKFNVFRNRNFVFIFLPAHLLNTVSASAPTFFLSSLFGLSTNGYFFKAARIGEAPTGIIRSSLGNVFWQKASEDFINNGNTRKLMRQFLFKLIILAVPGFSILYFFAEELFVFLFGDQWIDAAYYYKILAPYYFLQFVITPVAIMVVLSNKPWIDITWQIFYALAISASFLYGWYENDAMTAIKAYSILMSLMLLVSLAINYRYAIRR